MEESASRLDGSLDEAASLIERGLHPAAILLFGSALSGRLRADSDLDFAVLVGGGPPDPLELAVLRVELAALLHREVDLVVLDTASPILAMEVLRKHRILGKRDPSAWQHFIVKTLSAYFDLKRVRQPIEAAIQRGSNHR